MRNVFFLFFFIIHSCFSQSDKAYDKAYADLKKEKYEKAIEGFSKVLILDKNRIEAYSNRAFCYRIIGKYSLAQKDIDTALLMNNKDPMTLKEQAVLLVMKKNYPEALIWIKKAINADPKNSQIYNVLGGIYITQEDYGNAVGALTKAIELDPNYDTPYFNRGISYKYLEQYGSALTDLKKHVQLEKTSYRTYYEMAVCSEFIGDYFAAVEYYTKALKYFKVIDPYEDTYHKSNFLYARANAYTILEKHLLAKKDLRKAERSGRR